jgi:hypothetical protein
VKRTALSIGFMANIALSAGCASTTGVGNARVLADGEHQLSFGVELGAATARLAPTQPVPAPWPQLGLGYRRGLGGIELGARAWGFGLPAYVLTLGAASDVKVPLLRTPSIESGIDAAIGLEVGYHQINISKAPTHLFTAQIPLTAGCNIGGGDQVLFGLRFLDQLMTGPDLHPVNMIFFGVSVGFVWRALPFVEVHPEVVLLYSPVSFNGLGDDSGRHGLTVLQLGIGNVLIL